MAANQAFRSGLGFGPRREFGQFPVFDPTLCYYLFDDFNGYTASDWSIGGTGSAAHVDGEGGLLKLSVGTDFTDAVALGWAGKTGALARLLRFSPGKKVVVGARFRHLTPGAVGSVDLGLSTSIGDFLFDPPESFGRIRLTIGTNVLTDFSGFISSKSNTFSPFAANVWERLDLVFDGVQSLIAYRNGIEINRMLSSPPLDGSKHYTPYLMLSTGIALASELEVDYFYAAKER